MSLFDELQKGEIIEKPRQIGSYHRILKEKKEKTPEEEKAERKELCKQKKAELSKEEFKEWRQKEWYQRNKEKVIEYGKERYHNEKKEDESLIEEIYKDVYDKIPEPIDIDDYYTEKFKKDDTISGEYKFARWSSRLKRIPWRKYSRQHFPFRISHRHGLDNLLSQLPKTQLKAYQYLLPHMDEIMDCPITLRKKQWPNRYPAYLVGESLQTLADASDINNSHIICVADAMRRGKYIPGEAYLGRNSFIFGDVVVTNTGHLFRIALEDNLKRLTPDTVEEIHKKRIDWWKKKADNDVPIMLLGDAYLLKVPINERENLYFITPT